MDEPQMGNAVSAEEMLHANVKAPAAPEEKICCTRCAAEIAEADAVCPVCGFDWSEARKRKITRYFHYFCIGFVFSLLIPLLPRPVPGHLLTPMLLRLLMSGLSVAGTVFGMMFLYQCWSLIPKKNRSAWPGQYVGFLFIPLYNLYWMFPSYYGLLKWQNALLPEEKRGNKGIYILLFLILPYAFFLFMLISAAVLFLSGIIHFEMLPDILESPLYKFGLLVIYIIPMGVIGILAFLQIERGACSLMTLPAEEKKKIMMSVPGAPGAKKTSLWPVWTFEGCCFVCIFILIIIGIIAVIFVHAIDNSEERKSLLCCSNLKQIGLALKMYEDANKEKYPADCGEKGLWVLVGKHYIPEQTLICPHSKKSSGQKDTSYVYLGGLNSEAAPDMILVVCKGSGNKGKNIRFNVLFADGSAHEVILPGKAGYAELFRKYGILDDRNGFTEKGKQLPQETRDYILRLVREQPNRKVVFRKAKLTAE